nr:MAG TPA: hypothetical protein [Caudoviricetes sp.]
MRSHLGLVFSHKNKWTQELRFSNPLFELSFCSHCIIATRPKQIPVEEG